MPRRPKPAAKPFSLPLATAAPDLDHPIYAQALALIPDAGDAAGTEELSAELQRIMSWYALDLHDSAQRPSDPLRRLKAVRDALLKAQLKAQRAIEALSDDERRTLDRVTSWRISSVLKGPRCRPTTTIRATERALRAMVEAADVAIQYSKPTKGRPKGPEGRFVEMLINFWERANGRRPTLITNVDTYEKYGPFLEFVRLVANHVRTALGLKPAPLAGNVQAILYPPDDDKLYPPDDDKRG
ncbi:MAG: hypothetical protein EA405_15650 [Rhodospirillales bacterium]|nr:MAG: hypothetical protein EA405_15650 [Rhodospirillales bacterium]